VNTITVDAPLDEATMEDIFAAEDLRITLKSTLIKYPGCVHWHLKRGKETGTLEATLWQGKCWFSMSMGRMALWLEPCAERMKQVLEADFERNTSDS
jgi:hypothetical protein